MRPGWTPPEFEAGDGEATRATGKKVMQSFKPFTPTMSAARPTSSSRPTRSSRAAASSRGRTRAASRVRDPRARDGLDRQRHRRARRHLKPFGSTFLIFSDYMRPAVRPVGADERAGRLGVDARLRRPRRGRADAPAGRALMALRAIPNFWFVRPADANETAWAWKVALDRDDGPVGLSLSRQKVPTLDRSALAPATVSSGARTRSGTRGDGEPDLMLIAYRFGGRARARSRAEDRRRERDERPRRVDAVLGALRGPVVGVPRLGAAAGGEGAALGRGGRHARLEELGRRPRRLARHRAVRRLGSGQPGPRRRLGFTVDNVVAKATALLKRVS